jgi:uncharacterized membrane protein YfcA
LEIATLTVAVLTVFVAQLVKGITGFGSALVTVPVLALLWGPREAVLVATAVDLFSGAFLAIPVRRMLRPWLIGVVFLPMAAGQWVGTDLLTTLPEGTVRLLLGLVVAAFALDMLWRPVRTGVGELEDLPPDPRRLYTYGALSGAVGGVMGGLVGTPGPPVVVFMRRFFREAFFRAQLIAVFACASVTLCAMLWLKGVGDADSVRRTGVLLLPLFAGNVLGARLAGRMDRATFGRLVGGVLLVAGTMLALG